MIVSRSNNTSKRALSIQNQDKHYESESGHSVNSQSRSSVFNRYGEEYSFNRQDTFSKDQPSPQARDRQVYRPAGLQEGQSLLSRNPQLIRKYESIYQQLQDIQGKEVLYLFLEQIEENQQNRQKISSNQRAVRKLEQEIVELKLLLDKKRQAIRKLCETESNNLNLIQCLQLNSDKKINLENHYFSKYRELQAYISQYITNTNEAQEQFVKNYKIAKNENQRIITSYEKLQHQLFSCSKELQLKSIKQSKLLQSQNVSRQREKTLIIQIQNLQEQNSSLRKSVQQLAQKLRTNEQFQVQLAKQNRQLSSELDFIREKINQNQSLSRDIFEKMQSHSQMNQRLLKQKQQLQNIVSDIRNERDTVIREKQQLLQNINFLTADLSNLKQNNLRLLEVINQKDAIIQQLEQDLKIMRREEQELLMEYQNEKQSKQSIKCQLLDLAEQVKYMENTYQRQISKNGKIKDQLQRFWQKNGVPLKQISNESRNLSHSQSFKSSKGSMSRTFKDDQNNEYLF